MITGPKGFVMRDPKADRRLLLIAISTVVLFGLACGAGFLFERRFGSVITDNFNSFALLVIGVMFAGLFYSAHAYSRRERQFWIDVAQSYGWTYSKHASLKDNPAVLLRQSGKFGKHMLSGMFQGIPFRMCQYQILKHHPLKKRVEVWPFTIFEFTFKGRFPHFYLNYHHNFNPSYFERMSLPKVQLPAGMEKDFTLYVPKQYEIEALAIFSPDTLAFLLDNKWTYDVEMHDNRVLIFASSIPPVVKDLQQELEKVRMFAEHFATKLDRASFAPIGNLPYRL